MSVVATAANTASTRVFIPDTEFVWVTGEVLSQYSVVNNKDGSETYVADVKVDDPEVPKDKQGIRQVPVPQFDPDAPSHTFPLQNPEMPKDGVQDMCTLSYLHEPSILDNLRR